jgi:hypothetical protein
MLTLNEELMPGPRKDQGNAGHIEIYISTERRIETLERTGPEGRYRVLTFPARCGFGVMLLNLKALSICFVLQASCTDSPSYQLFTQFV